MKFWIFDFTPYQKPRGIKWVTFSLSHSNNNKLMLPTKHSSMLKLCSSK